MAKSAIEERDLLVDGVFMVVVDFLEISLWSFYCYTVNYCYLLVVSVSKALIVIMYNNKENSNNKVGSVSILSEVFWPVLIIFAVIAAEYHMLIK